MQQNTEDKENDSIWIRLVYMLLFGLILSVAETVVFITALIAFASKLLNGSVNVSVLTFGRNLGKYINQVVSFLTFNSEEHPFPLGAWPDDRSNTNNDSGTDLQKDNASEKIDANTNNSTTVSSIKSDGHDDAS